MLPNPLQIFMREKLRCAVIGVGAIGIEHLNSLLHCPRAATVAIAETHPQRLREAAEKFHIPRAYSNYRELLEQPDIDAVTIALPNYLHAPVAIDALNARKHVLIEKPMATNARTRRKSWRRPRKIGASPWSQKTSASIATRKARARPFSAVTWARFITRAVFRIGTARFRALAHGSPKNNMPAAAACRTAVPCSSMPCSICSMILTLFRSLRPLK